MKYYLDITLLPDVEVNLGFLWEKIYQQIHLMLVDNKVADKNSAVGISFPKYKNHEFPLGDKLRLFAPTEAQLSTLNLAKWLSKFEDYVHIKAIKAVPSNVNEYAYFKRRQFKSATKLRNNIDQRAQKIAAKNNFDVNEVKKRLLASLDKLDSSSTLPFINLQSLSSNKNINAQERKKFLLFIELVTVKTAVKNSGMFTCYGLSRRQESQQVAVPWFEG